MSLELIFKKKNQNNKGLVFCYCEMCRSKVFQEISERKVNKKACFDLNCIKIQGTGLISF